MAAKRRKKEDAPVSAHIIAVNMGYGHERPAFTMRHLAVKKKIWIANEYEGIPVSDQRLWEEGRKLYEKISRFKHVPVVGDLAFKIMDELQEIPPFYPRRDLSRPNLQVMQFYALIRKRGFMKHLIEELSKDPKPLFCTFMTPAFAAEEHGYPGDIYVLATDSDISRTWAPLHPKRSRIRYLAPNGRVVERLKLYGVPEKQIELTGFPLPASAIGGVPPKKLLQDLKRRLCNLDPEGIFASRAAKTLQAHLGASTCKTIARKKPQPITIAFAVGGAGAQREIGIEIAKSLRADIRRGRVKLVLIAGSRKEVYDAFVDALKEAGLGSSLRDGRIEVLYEDTREKYFLAFETAVRTWDVLWTKPSELSFYTGLGLPIIMAPTVGSQEDYNHAWIQQMAAGMDQFDPKYTNEWLFDWIRSGALARMAWNGYMEAPTHGAYRIEDVLAGRKNTIHDLPLIV